MSGKDGVVGAGVVDSGSLQMTLLAGEAAQSILLAVPVGVDLFGSPRINYLCCSRRADGAGLEYFLHMEMSEATWWPRSGGGYDEVLADAKASAAARGLAQEMEIPMRMLEDKLLEIGEEFL